MNKRLDEKEEIERLKQKINQYEDPEDMTLMYMWCDEKAKDEVERLHSIIKEVREYIENNTWHSMKDILKILDKENKE